ncbi:MAG: hypothetical protein WD027_02975 [Gaiellales bacterium]
MNESHAVLWRKGSGPIYSGKVELGAHGLRLEGLCHGRQRSVTTIRYEDLVGLSLTRSPARCVYGKLTLMLELRGGGAVGITSRDGFATVRELEERITNLVPRIPVD